MTRIGMALFNYQGLLSALMPCFIPPAGDTDARVGLTRRPCRISSHSFGDLAVFLAIGRASRWWRPVRPVPCRMPEPEKVVTDAAVN